MTNQAVFYWDLTERERAALSRDDVERYVDAELMTKGVLKARPPKLEPEPKEAVRLSQRFQVKSAATEHWHTPKLLFPTEDAARAFLDLQPEHVHSSYTGEGHIEHGQAFSQTVTAVSIIVAEDYEANKSLLQSATSIRVANKKASEEHEKAVKAQDEALKGLWEDWSTQRQRDHKLRGVMATYEEYRRIAASQDVALRFLRKVHSVSQIEEAAEWCDVALPADWESAEVEAAPAPAPEMTSDETAAMEPGKPVMFWASDWLPSATPGMGPFVDDERGQHWQDETQMEGYEGDEPKRYYAKSVTHWRPLPKPPEQP